MSGDLYDLGLTIRREVVGDAYVDASIGNVDDFDRDFQTLATEFCWGAVWGRDGLPRTTRSVINIALLCALNRPRELALHVRGAIRNGVSEAEIREVLLQVAVYAGVPAGVDGFRVARAALADIGDGDGQEAR